MTARAAFIVFLFASVSIFSTASEAARGGHQDRRNCWSSDDRYPCGGGTFLDGSSLGAEPLSPVKRKKKARGARRPAQAAVASADPSDMTIMTPLGVELPVRSSTAPGCLPGPLAAKVAELQRSCGSIVISGFRGGSSVCGRRGCVLSNHALCKAVDMRGNPACMMSHLIGWPGGLSNDYASVRCRGKPCPHYHISYNPPGGGANSGREWGVRFAHHGTGGRYAKRGKGKHRVAVAR